MFKDPLIKEMMSGPEQSCAYISRGVFSPPGRLTEIKNVAEFGQDRFYDVGMVGSDCWKVIHALAESGEYFVLCILLQTFSWRFVCTKCRVHITEYLSGHIETLYAAIEEGDTQGVLKWTIDFHNCVNARLGKSIFSNEAISRTYPKFDWSSLPQQQPRSTETERHNIITARNRVKYIARGLCLGPDQTTLCVPKCALSKLDETDKTTVPSKDVQTGGIWYCIYLLVACGEINAGAKLCEKFGHSFSPVLGITPRGAIRVIMGQNRDPRDPARIFYELTTGADIDGAKKQYSSRVQ